MTIFYATSLVANDSELETAVTGNFDEHDRYRIQNGRGWLIKYPGTAVELSNFLGITGQQEDQPAAVKSAMVLAVTTYYGRGPTDMWEWIKTRFDK